MDWTLTEMAYDGNQQGGLQTVKQNFLMKSYYNATHRRIALPRLPRAVRSAIVAGVAAVLLSLLPSKAVVVADPVDDDFESGVHTCGTSWVRTNSFKSGEFATVYVCEPSSQVEAQHWNASDSVGDDHDDAGEYRLYSFDLEPYFAGGLLRIQFESHAVGEEDQILADDAVISDDKPPHGDDEGESPQGGSAIELDGEFEDWSGRANIVDPPGDAREAGGDIIGLYWSYKPDDETTYWMIERPPGHDEIARYSLHLDMNDDGDFTDSVDRIVEVSYAPGSSRSRVDTKVRRADNNQLIAVDKNRDWGETTAEGSSRVEFGVSYSDLGFSFGSVFRTYVESSHGDRAPDAGDIQLTAIPILGYASLGATLLAGGLAIWWFRLREHEGKKVPQS